MLQVRGGSSNYANRSIRGVSWCAAIAHCIVGRWDHGRNQHQYYRNKLLHEESKSKDQSGLRNVPTANFFRKRKTSLICNPCTLSRTGFGQLSSSSKSNTNFSGIWVVSNILVHFLRATHFLQTSDLAIFKFRLSANSSQSIIISRWRRIEHKRK